VIDWVSGKVVEVTDLVRGASVLGAIIMVAVAYYKVRTLVAVIVAGLTAGVFLWAINNIEWFQTKVQEETGSGELFGDTWDFQEGVSARMDVVFVDLPERLDNSSLGNHGDG
jgi:hypothetical protein